MRKASQLRALGIERERSGGAQGLALRANWLGIERERGGGRQGLALRANPLVLGHVLFAADGSASFGLHGLLTRCLRQLLRLS